MPQNNDVSEVDIKSVLILIFRKSWIILLVAVLLAGLAFGYAKLFITPKYSASIQLYTNNIYEDSKGEIQAGQLTAAAYLAEAYMIILEGKPVLSEVLKVTALQDKYTADQLRAMITADTINQTEIFQVTITCTNSREAAMIANAFAEVLPRELPNVVNGSDVRLVDYAVESKQVVYPRYKEIMLIFGVIGALIAFVAILLREFLDDSIETEEYLTSAYAQIPLLAVIPDAKESKGKKYYKRYYSSYYNSGKKNTNGGKAL